MGSKPSRFKKGKIQIPNKQNNHPQQTMHTEYIKIYTENTWMVLHFGTSYNLMTPFNPA